MLPILILDDGIAGHTAQARGLAEALARRCQVEMTLWQVSRSDLAGRLPARLATALPSSWRGDPDVTPGTLVIGCGRRSAVTAAAIRRPGIAVVQILRPPVPTDRFDLVIAPEHDRMSGAVQTVGAINRMTPETVAAAALLLENRIAKTDRPRMAVLLGGPSGSARWTTEDDDRVVTALQSASETHDLLITPSRRTEARTLAAVAALRPAFLWDGTGDNPYPGILGLSTSVLVTADSVNMASEAATAGLPVQVLPVSRIAEKFHRFHDSLASRGVARPWSGEAASWPVTPLAEADRVAAIVIDRCLPDHAPA